MLDMVDSLKKLVAAAQARDLVGVLAAAGEVLTHAATLKKAWDQPAVSFGSTAHADAELADRVAELEECKRECSTVTMGAAGTAALDPATLLLVIDAVLKVVALFRRRQS